MIHDSITFSVRFCIPLGILLFLLPSKLIKKTKEISEAKQQQDITPNRILKKGSIENLDEFLKTIEKIVKKKRRLAYSFNQKSNMGKQNSKTVVINIFSNSGKKKLPIATLLLIFEKDVEDVAMISANVYGLVCQLKRAQVFAIFIKNLKY